MSTSVLPPFPLFYDAAEAQRARLLQQMRGTSAKAKGPPPKKPAAPAQNQGQGIP